MTNKVSTTPYFERRYKRFAKKFPLLDIELLSLENELTKTPQMGEPLGANLYKIRLASEDKGAGKSGGFRVITYLIKECETSTEIFLITIYDKSEESTITKTALLKIVKSIFE